jgi:hypothetical protein
VKAKLEYDPSYKRPWFAWALDDDERKVLDLPLGHGDTPDEALDDLRAELAKIAARRDDTARNGEIVDLYAGSPR